MRNYSIEFRKYRKLAMWLVVLAVLLSSIVSLRLNYSRDSSDVRRYLYESSEISAHLGELDRVLITGRTRVYGENGYSLYRASVFGKTGRVRVSLKKYDDKDGYLVISIE